MTFLIDGVHKIDSFLRGLRPSRDADKNRSLALINLVACGPRRTANVGHLRPIARRLAGWDSILQRPLPTRTT